jgi:PAS domain S-box-containing protein
VPQSARIRYALIGSLFGLCFPVGATLIDAYMRGFTWSWSNLVEIQASQPLLWVIDTAPLFLGLFALFAGRRQDALTASISKALEANTQLEAENRELLLAARSESNPTEELIRTAVGKAQVGLGDMLDATPSCFKIVDRSGELMFMNRRGLDLIGAGDLPSVFGASVYDLVAPSHRAEFVAFNERVCNGESGSLIFEIVGLDGTRRWMETWAAPHELGHGETVQVAITNDISERVAVQRQIERQRRELMQSQKLAAVGEFAAGLGHEINNPLAIISGTAGLLVAEYADGEQPEADRVRQDLEKIEATAIRIRNIADGLKLLTREDDESPRVVVNLSEIVRQTGELCEPLLRSNGVRFEVDVPDHLEVVTNPVQVEQVLMNLISNALHAVRDLRDPWISVRAGPADSGLVRLRVTDAGHLLDPEVIERMLDPFFTTKDVGEGTGLGLSVSRALMESLGGLLTFDGAAENTTFCIDIPSEVT